MIIAYEEVLRKPQEHGQPELYVGVSGGFLLSLRSTDFEVRYKDGKAEVSLHRHMSPEQVLELSEALVKALKTHAERSTYVNVGTVVVAPLGAEVKP